KKGRKKKKADKVIPDLTNEAVVKYYKNTKAYNLHIKKFAINYYDEDLKKCQYCITYDPYTVKREFACDVGKDVNALNQGGRFYGAPWHTMNKKTRKGLAYVSSEYDPKNPFHIPMVELDFPSHHPRLLYILLGLAKEQSEIQDMYTLYDST